MTFSDDQVQRYSRHILLPEMGGVGQEQLLEAELSVVLEPQPGIAESALAYLAAAGLGTLRVHGSRQLKVTPTLLATSLLLGPDDLGLPLGERLCAALRRQNPDVTVLWDESTPASTPLAMPALTITTMGEALHQGALAASQHIVRLLQA